MASISLPPTTGIRVKRSPSPLWHVDFSLIMATITIAGLGLLMVYSATRKELGDASIDPHTYLKRQLVWVALGVAGMLLMTVLDYRLVRELAPVAYVGTVLILLAVLSPLGSVSKGTQAWFQLGPYQLQPSEYAKLGLIVCVAAYCSTHRGELGTARLVSVLTLAALPMALIYRQPDLGTALVFVAVLMGVLLVAGVRVRHLVALTALGVIGVVAVFQLGVLKQYQVDRLRSFIDSTSDSQRATYNLNQSKIAIGSGGVRGKGLFEGTQTNLSYVPEQRTDFIFTVVGEELGLVGAVTLLALFALVVWRIWRIASLSKDLFGTLLCVGVLAMLVFQIFENMGMTMGIMPVTGIPLPFVSYGGSSTVASFLAIGLVLNVHMRRFS